MPPDDLRWQPYREPFHITLARTGAIALVVGAVLAWRWGGLARWPLATLLVLWPSFGGHWVEVGFLNLVRPHINAARIVQVVVRIAVWFVGGVALFLAMNLTADLLGDIRAGRWFAWWMGGPAFIGVELVAHLGLVILGRPSFYDGRG